MHRVIWALSIIFMITGCSETKPKGSCSANATCGPGEVCMGGQCSSLCRTDPDCGANDCATGRICQQDVCVPGCRKNGPVIISVDGDGTSDDGPLHPDGQRTINHMQNQILVEGKNLLGCTATLSANTEIPLEVTSSTDALLVATLPDSLTEGHYVLTLANAIGQDQTAVWVLQGEPGPPGPAPTSSDIQIAINSMTSINADLNCVDCISQGELASAAVAEDNLSAPLLTSGGNYLPNPYFSRRTGTTPDAWDVQASGVAPTYTTADVSSDAWAGPFALENGDSTLVILSSTVRVAIDRGATYHAVGSLRRSSVTGSVGEAVLGVRLFDSAGAEILGAGSDWWRIVARGDPGVTWSRWEQLFGAGTADPFPVDARTMTLAARLNDDNSTAGNQLFQVQGLGLYTVVGDTCPSDMVDAGAYCIDRDLNVAANWQLQAALCQQEGKQMCSLAQWIGACDARASIGMNVDVTAGPVEYVDEYWVMNYVNSNYYSSYVSVGGTACGRIFYSGWACANSTCTDTTNPGPDQSSRCCKPN